tara:strand:- start:18352 stop:18588 length:237 start_codon:yes stop_codon:yes gene_type:complete
VGINIIENINNGIFLANSPKVNIPKIRYGKRLILFINLWNSKRAKHDREKINIENAKGPIIKHAIIVSEYNMPVNDLI